MTMVIKETSTRIACCFAGPRPQSLPFGLENDTSCLRLKQVLKEQIIFLVDTLQVTHFISGVDLGVGQYAAEIVLDLKRDYPELTLECAIPCEKQAENWTVAQRERYFSIVEYCDKETLLQHHYTKDCMKKQKEYLINQSNYMIAVWNGKPGYICNILSFARALKKPLIVINPNTFEIHSYFLSNQNNLF